MLLTAKEAAAIADEAVEEFLIPIGELITGRAAAGGRSLTDPFGSSPGVPQDLIDGTILKLIDAGFTVDTEPDDLEGPLVIRW